MWKIFGSQVKNSISTIDMTIKRLLIALTLVFWMGLNNELLGANKFLVEDKVFNVLSGKIAELPRTIFKDKIIDELKQSVKGAKESRTANVGTLIGRVSGDFSKLRSFDKGKVLARNFSGLIGGIKIFENDASSSKQKVNGILNGLQIGDNEREILSNRNLSLHLIRSFCDLEQLADSNMLETDEVDLDVLIEFFKMTNQIFYHSRRLLNLVVIPDIAELYGTKYMKIRSYSDLNFIMQSFSINENEGASTKSRNIIQNFSINNLELQSILTKKTEGIHFGAKIEISQSEDFQERKFFLKAYHGYPAIEKKDSNDTTIDTSRKVKSTGGEDTDSITIRKLDLKEPFVYKFFSSVNLGPNVVFPINPYINNGFFILTEDLSNEFESIVFFEASEFKGIDNDIRFVERLRERKTYIKRRDNIEIDDLIFQDKLSHRQIFINTTELSIISLIFELNDIKEENFGFVLDEMQVIHSNKLKGPFIIDFLAPDSYETKVIIPNYKECDIRKKFFTGENIFVPNNGTGQSIYFEIIKSLDILDYIKSYHENRSDLEKFESELKILEAKKPATLEKKDKINLTNLRGKIKVKKSVLSRISEKLGSMDKQIVEVKRDLNEKLYLGILALQQFNTRIENIYVQLQQPESVISISPENDEIDGKFRSILVSQSQYIKSLMLQPRGTDDKPDEAMLKHPITKQPRTNAELIGFKSRGNTPRLVEEPINFEYIEDAFEDLDNYCEDIIFNYKEIKKLLNTNVDDLIEEFLPPVSAE